MKYKKIEAQHRKKIRDLEKKSKAIELLKKLYLLNKKDPEKKNDNLINILSDIDLLMSAFEKIKKNKGAATPGTVNESPEGMDLEKIKTISNEIKTGTYKWRAIRRKEVPKPGKKKKRPLGVVNFYDKLLQEAIRLILTSIYEPVFQKYELNQGFRPDKSTETAIIKLQRESKEMDWALEGDVKGAYDNVDHFKMIEILKKKITDKKFLRLIQTGLSQGIYKDQKVIKNLLGTPQGGIVSPILFNIYMHEFDVNIRNKMDQIAEEKNEKEKRTKAGKYHSVYRKYSSRIEKAKKKLKTKKLSDTERKELFKRMRDSKKAMLKVEAKDKASLLARFTYIRYADDWIILTNTQKKDVQNLKEYCSKWLKEMLHLELDEDKTVITDLHKEKCKFLGFTIYKKKKRVIRKTNKEGNIFRQRSTVELTIGMDHDRVIQRLKDQKLLWEKTLKPKAVGILISLKPWQITEHFKQKMEGLGNYYYRTITNPYELNRYHYIYRFCCLKTIARREKKSIKKITIKYGKETKINYIEKVKNKKGEIEEKKRNKSFITLQQFHTSQKALKKKKESQFYSQLRKEKKRFSKEEFDAQFGKIIEIDNTPKDPFSKNLFSINLRSQYQMAKYCSICGVKPTKENPIEMHHIKHVRKGKLSGFSEVMKNLNRKTIPTCRKCHRKIHKGEYDGYNLTYLYDQDLITA